MSENIIHLDEYRNRRYGNQCPECRSTAIVSILYGYPSREFLGRRRDDPVLGGCIVDDDSPDWHCKDCGHQF